METSVDRTLDKALILWATFCFGILAVAAPSGALGEPLFWWVWAPSALLGGVAVYLRVILR